MSPNAPKNTRSCRPLAARAWRIRKSWRWNSRFATGFRPSVSPAVASATTIEASRTGRKIRSALTPAARKATISKSLARRTLLVVFGMLGAAAIVTKGPDAADPVDRLDQFRQLARSHASLGHGDAAESPDAYRDMYALLDEEIVESLGAGGLYASAGFLQDRLDAFGAAWGAAAVDVLRVRPLVVGAFQMSAAPGVNSVRGHSRLGGEGRLVY